jgi:hypothetical protein
MGFLTLSTPEFHSELIQFVYIHTVQVTYTAVFLSPSPHTPKNEITNILCSLRKFCDTRFLVLLKAIPSKSFNYEHGCLTVCDTMVLLKVRIKVSEEHAASFFRVQLFQTLVRITKPHGVRARIQ